VFAGLFAFYFLIDSFLNFILKFLDFDSGGEILNYTIYPFLPYTFKELDI